MKMTGLIFFLIFAQITVAFFDVFQGAVHSMHNTFGKLVTDVVSNVRHNIDCSIRSMQSVIDKDASSRFARDSDCNRQADLSRTINKEANVKNLGNKKQLHKTLTSETNKKTDRVDNPGLAKDLLSILNRTAIVRKVDKSLETDKITEIVKDLENNSNNTLVEIEKQLDNMKILESIQSNEFKNIMKISQPNSEIEKITRSIYPRYFKDAVKKSYIEKSSTDMNKIYNKDKSKTSNFVSTTSSSEYVISGDQAFIINEDKSTINLFNIEYDKQNTVESDITTEHGILMTYSELDNSINNKNNTLETPKNDSVLTTVLNSGQTSENSIVASTNIHHPSSMAEIKQTTAQNTVSDNENDVYSHNSKETQFMATSTDSSDKKNLSNLEQYAEDNVSTKTINFNNDFDDMGTENINFKNEITTLNNIVSETMFVKPSITDETTRDIYPRGFKKILSESSFSTKKNTDTGIINESYTSINSDRTDNTVINTNTTLDSSNIMKEEHTVNSILGSQFISNNGSGIKNDSYTLSYTNIGPDLSNVLTEFPTENSNYINPTINDTAIINPNNISMDTSTTRSKNLFTENYFSTMQYIKSNDSNIINESHTLSTINVTPDVSNISKENTKDDSLGTSPTNDNEPILGSYKFLTKTDTTLHSFSEVPTEKSLFIDQNGTIYENLTMTELNALNNTDVTLNLSTVLPEVSIESTLPTIQTVTINNSDTTTESYTLTNADANAHLSTVFKDVATELFHFNYTINDSDIITEVYNKSDAKPHLSIFPTELPTQSSFPDNQTVTINDNDAIKESRSSTLINLVTNPDSLTVLEEPTTEGSLSTYPIINKDTTTESYKKPVNIEETDTLADLTTVTREVSRDNTYFTYQIDTMNNSDVIIESREFINTDVTPDLTTVLSEVTTANDLPSYQIVTIDDNDPIKKSYILFNKDVTPVFSTTLDDTTTEVTRDLNLINYSNVIIDFPSELMNTKVTPDLLSIPKELSTEISIATNQMIALNDSDVTNEVYTPIDRDVTSDFPILAKDTTENYFSTAQIVTINNSSTTSNSHSLTNANHITDLTVLEKVTIEDSPSTNLNNDKDAITNPKNISMNIDTTTDLPLVIKELPDDYSNFTNQFATNNESETITESQPIINTDLTPNLSTELKNLATENSIPSNFITGNDTITEFYNTSMNTETTLNQSISGKESTENSLTTNSFLNDSHITNNSHTLNDNDNTLDFTHVLKEVPNENDNTDLKTFSTSINIEYTTAVSSPKEQVPYETSTYQSDSSYTNMDSTEESTNNDNIPEVTTPNVDVTAETNPTNSIIDSSLEDYEAFFKFSEEDTDFEEIADDALNIFEQSKRSQMLINSIFENDEIASNVFDYPELVQNEKVIKNLTF